MGNSIGARISEIREAKGYSQSDFAKLINVSQPTLSRWENGSRQPKAVDLTHICDKINMSLNEFFNGDLEMYERLKKKLMIMRVCLIVAVFSLVLLTAFITVPKYRVVEVSEPFEGYIGNTISIVIQPVLWYDEDSAHHYCEKVADKYKEYDAVEMIVVKRGQNLESEDAELFNFTCVHNPQ